MPLIKIPFKPGINREIPEYANEGGFDFSNLIRFRMGYAEKIGGWANTNYVYWINQLAIGNDDPAPTYTFNGVTRSLHNWVTLDTENLIGFGTTQQFYVQNEIGTFYHDIAPTAYQATLTGASFRTVAAGSPLVEVTNVTGSIMSPTANDGLDVGSVVYFYAPALAGFLLQEDGFFILQENPYAPPGSPDGWKFIVGSQPSFSFDGVTIQAQQPRGSTTAVPYFVTAVTRKFVNYCTVSATDTTITVTGTVVDTDYPIVGCNILMSGLTIPEYNGAAVVLSSTFNSATNIVTLTYANPAGSNLGPAINGSATWITSFRFVADGAATIGNISGDPTLAILGQYLPNTGNTTVKYTPTGRFTYSKRAWSQASFGDDLIMSIQGNPIYYWPKDTDNWLPAVTLADYANTQVYQQATITNSVYQSYTFNVEFSDYIYVGQTITINDGYGTIPTNTKITALLGATVTVDKQVTLYNGAGGIVSGAGSANGTDGTYTNVSLTNVSVANPAATGAKATIVIASGTLASVTITTAGTGYTHTDLLGCSVSGITSFSYTVNEVSNSSTVINVSYSGQFVPTQTNKIFVSSVYQFVIALGANPYNPFDANTTFNPLLVRWSDQSNPSEWIPKATNQAGEQTLGSGSGLVTAVTNLQVVLLFTDTAVYQMQYIGAPFVFSFTLLQDNISIISQNAALTANNVTWWMGTDKFYMFNGTVQVLPCPLRRYVFSDINRSAAWQIVVGYNEGFSEIWWFYPSSKSNINDSYIKYNFVDNVWDYGSLRRTAWLGQAIRDYPLAAFSVQNTYLTSYVDATATTIPVADTSSFHDSGILIIGTEQIVYTAKTATSFLNCIRTNAPSTFSLRMNFNVGDTKLYVAVQIGQPIPADYYQIQVGYYAVGYGLPSGGTVVSKGNDGFGYYLVVSLPPTLTRENSWLNFGTETSAAQPHDAYTPVKLLTPNQIMFHEYGIDDHSIDNVTLPVQSFIQTSDVGLAEGNQLFTVNRIIPDLTFTNTNEDLCPNPVLTVTVYPRLNPGSDYQYPGAYGVDQPLIISTQLPPPEPASIPPEQYAGTPHIPGGTDTRVVLTAGQGQIYTRVRGRVISVRYDTGDGTDLVDVPGYPLPVPKYSIGNMWQLGLMRFDVRNDGKR